MSNPYQTWPDEELWELRGVHKERERILELLEDDHVCVDMKWSCVCLRGDIIRLIKGENE